MTSDRYQIFKDTFFKSNLLIEAIICVGFGLFTGYVSQIEADSGDYIPESIYRSVLAGGLSYFFATFVAWAAHLRFRKFPTWVLLGMVGTIFWAFTRCVVLYYITNLYLKGSSSAGQYFLQLLPDMLIRFFGVMIIDGFAVLLLLAMIRTLFGLLALTRKY